MLQETENAFANINSKRKYEYMEKYFDIFDEEEKKENEKEKKEK